MIPPVWGASLGGALGGVVSKRLSCRFDRVAGLQWQSVATLAPKPSEPEPPPAPAPTVAPPLTVAEVIGRLDIAFQPVVNLRGGHCSGFEALLRGHEAFGFAAPTDFFAHCRGLGILPEVEAALGERAATLFAALPDAAQSTLFINLCGDRLEDVAAVASHVHGTIARLGIAPSAVAFDIRAARLAEDEGAATEFLGAIRATQCKMALDNFGDGSSNYRLLHAVQPDFLKIGRFFIAGIAEDRRKKVIVSQMAGIAHLFGIVVIAVGVETEREFLTCKELGIDLIQGNLIAAATTDATQLPAQYEVVDELNRRDHRAKTGDRTLIDEQMDRLAPLRVDTEMTTVFTRLSSDPQHTFLPIVDHGGRPVGIVQEKSLKNYVYSAYGKDLIANKKYGRKLTDFVVRCPIADLTMPLEKILAIYSADDEAECILLVDHMQYVGFLAARAIIRAVNEKTVALARDQNPLTKLPGNTLINAHIDEALADTEGERVFAYLDFDNFKPFNDKYGFRQGDRAILLFAELMKKKLNKYSCFIGHIGGDDFFAGFAGVDHAKALGIVENLISSFANDALIFYDAEARKNKFIEGVDRQGRQTSFPLLSASAVVVGVPAGIHDCCLDQIATVIATLKKKSKAAESKTASYVFGQA